LALTGYDVATDDGDYILDAISTISAPATSHTYTVPAGPAGKTYRFRIAARNVLGLGVWSDEIQLVATDAPASPTLSLLASSRTLTGGQLRFGKPLSDGGSPIIGYHLYRDEGIAGSPFVLIFNGTSQPELVSHNLTGLQTALTYSFQLYAVNKIFRSTTPATKAILIGTLPDRPLNVTRDDVAYVNGEIKIKWLPPSHTGGLALTSYEVWVDDGAGDFTTRTAPMVTPAPSASSAIITGLVHGGTFGIKMTAINAVGTDLAADIVYLVCGDKPTAPAAPTADATTKNSITLAWNAPSSDGGSAVTGYSIYLNDLSVGDWTLAYQGEGYPTR
jgi:hypothetical protein